MAFTFEQAGPRTRPRLGPLVWAGLSLTLKAGWIVLHAEGEPYDRGYQQRPLMAPEIAHDLKALAQARSLSSPSEGWKSARTLVDALFLRRYDKEYLEEMKGIADDALAAGATFGRASP